MPSVTPEGADDSPLDTLIGMGDMTLDTTTQGVMDLGFRDSAGHPELRRSRKHGL